MAILTDFLKTDIAHVGDFLCAPNGDLGLISGPANLKRALFHRLVTIPGTLVHRPTYGIGIGMYQNALNSLSTQQQLATLIQEQFMQDARVQSVRSVAVDTSDDNPQNVIIRIFITAVGYTEQQMNFQPFSPGTIAA